MSKGETFGLPLATAPQLMGLSLSIDANVSRAHAHA
nr:MAG TPA: hypothetical protein [Microviridae sp.]